MTLDDLASVAAAASPVPQPPPPLALAAERVAGRSGDTSCLSGLQPKPPTHVVARIGDRAALLALSSRATRMVRSCRFELMARHASDAARARRTLAAVGRAAATTAAAQLLLRTRAQRSPPATRLAHHSQEQTRTAAASRRPPRPCSHEPAARSCPAPGMRAPPHRCVLASTVMGSVAGCTERGGGMHHEHHGRLADPDDERVSPERFAN